MTRSVVAAALLVLVLAAPAAAAKGWIVVDQPGFPIGQLQFSLTSSCPNGGVSLEIPAYAFPEPVTITRSYIWLGTFFGIPYPVVDLHTTIFTSRPWGFVLSVLGMDRYAPPNGPHDKERTHRHPLLAGDMVGGEISCAPVIWWLGSGITASVILDYEKTGR